MHVYSVLEARGIGFPSVRARVYTYMFVRFIFINIFFSVSLPLSRPFLSSFRTAFEPPNSHTLARSPDPVAVNTTTFPLVFSRHLATRAHRAFRIRTGRIAYGDTVVRPSTETVRRVLSEMRVRKKEKCRLPKYRRCETRRNVQRQGVSLTLSPEQLFFNNFLNNLTFSYFYVLPLRV